MTGVERLKRRIEALAPRGKDLSVGWWAENVGLLMTITGKFPGSGEAVAHALEGPLTKIPVSEESGFYPTYDHESWARIQTVILGALEDYPEARAAYLAELEKCKV
ncbi:MAG: hypothetical protein PHF57_09695 [Methanoregula sp.]|jgi:hypothetical protein|nr:hypothetical protein [Methanoregula sp.]